MGYKKEQYSQIKIFFLLLLYLFIFPIFLMEGSSCTGGTSHTGPTAIDMVALAPAVAPAAGDVQGLGSGNAAGPAERPPSTVGLDPGCLKGAKPQGVCKGEPLPPPQRPCPLGGVVIVDQAAGVWWCGCPEGTEEIFSEQNRFLVDDCLCPSGQGLLVNVDTGRALGCPMAARGEGSESSDQEEPVVVSIGNPAMAEAPLAPSGPPCHPPQAGCYIIHYSPNENITPKPVCYCPEEGRRRVVIENSTADADVFQIDSSSFQVPLFSR